LKRERNHLRFATVVLLLLAIVVAPLVLHARFVNAGYRVPLNSAGVAYDSAKGEIFVATDHGSGGSSLYVVSDSTNTVVARISVQGNVTSLAYDSAKGEVFVANSTNAKGSISVISDASNSLQFTFELGNLTQQNIPLLHSTTSLAYDSAKGQIFVASTLASAGNGSSLQIAVISDSTNHVVAALVVKPAFTSTLSQVQRLYQATSLAYDSAKGEVFVAVPPPANSGIGSIAVISDATDNVTANIKIEGNVSSLAYDPAKGEVFMTNTTSATGSVSVISDATNSIVALVHGYPPVPCSPGPVPGYPPVPCNLAYDSAKGEVFVTSAPASGNGSVSVISDSTNSVVTTVPVGGDPYGLAYASTTHHVHVLVRQVATQTDSDWVISDSTNSLVAAVSLSSSASASTVVSSVQTANTTTNTQFDFALSASPSALNVMLMGHSEMTQTILVSITLLKGSPQPVSLTVSALPAGGNASFGSTKGTPPFNTTLNVNFSATAVIAGSYSVNITGIGGGETHSTVISIVVPATEQVLPLTNSTQYQPQLPPVEEESFHGLPLWTPWLSVGIGVLAFAISLSYLKTSGPPRQGQGTKGRRSFLKFAVGGVIGAVAVATGLAGLKNAQISENPIVSKLNILGPGILGPYLLPSFWITRIEVIQAVQTPDNHVPLIGHKRTFVRVFVQSQASVSVTGSLKASVLGGGTRELSPYFPALLAPQPLPGSSGNVIVVNASPQGSQRAQWNDTLNFELDDDMTDQSNGGSLTATIFSPTTGPETNPLGGQYTNIFKTTVVFTERIDLVVQGCVWTCNDNSDGSFNPTQWANAPKTPAPWTDYEIHRQYVENFFPVSSLVIEPLGGNSVSVFSGNLTQGRNWATQKLNGPNITVPSYSIVNMLDNWDTGGLHGLAWGQCDEEQNARDVRAGAVMAQEIAHSLSQVQGNDGLLFNHTFTQGNPGGFPDFPNGNIESDAMGLDLTGPIPQLLSNPASDPTYDIMSYHVPIDPQHKNCPDPYTYGKLLAYIRRWQSLSGVR